ncbi:hypothetical protein Pelo_14577 [Pelomyxa schiedti]|nr:hypothetical protein Pelo_14577 [Pelomyxa schiedti]
MGCCGSHKRLIPEGQQVFWWDEFGRGIVVTGPKEIRLGKYGRISSLEHHTASATQYVTITHKEDGHKTRIRGPTSVWFNPLEHLSITVEEAVHVGASEIMIVFSNTNSETEAMTPKIIRGPALHIPDVDETVHTFRWHGPDPRNPAKLIPGARIFQTLSVVPQDFSFSIPEVRTSDSAVLELQFQVFYELVSIEIMLDKTHDPVADFMNSLTADILPFAASLTYEAFLEKTDMLNNLECYHQLTSRASLIGFRITKVAYKGHRSGNLQQIQNEALQARTQLRIEAETEVQSQQMADMKLAKENERQKQKQALQKSDYEHNTLLSRIQHEETLAQQAREQELNLSRLKADNEEKLSYVEKLAALGVDLTTYFANGGDIAKKNL